MLWARCSKVFYAATHADVRELGSFDDVDFAADIARRVEEKKRKEKEKKGLMTTVKAEEEAAAEATKTTTTTGEPAPVETKTKHQQPPLIEIEQMLREEALVVWREYAALPNTKNY